MRVSVIINSQAGSVDEKLVEGKVREALFRCELRFISPKCLDDTDCFLAEEIGKSDFLMVCGGDGTVNVTLQSLIRVAGGRELPPICVVRSGTANDLAAEIGVSRKIEKAARSILDGQVRRIDLIELEAEDGRKAFMITNGGIGIPAATADAANRLRGALRKMAEAPTKGPGALQALAKKSYSVVKKMGPSMYTMLVAEALRSWDPKDWEIEVEIPGDKKFLTKASSILVNNQARIGSNMMPAPFTSNSDGLVNLLISDAVTLKDQVRAAISIRQGRTDQLELNRSFELPEFKLSSKDGRRSLTFFGDGEILLKDAKEITVRCLHQSLSVVVK